MGSSKNTDPQPFGNTHTRHVIRYWVWDICLLVIASGLFAAIVAILLSYDGQELPDWQYNINISTLVALLSTALRASMVTVVAEVIGQSKWTWFTEEPRPLRQLQTFDDASRGVLGSFKLIGILRFGFRGNPLAMAAGLITILSLAIGPFAQQAIKTTSCSQRGHNSSASLPIAYSMPGPDSCDVELYDIGTGIRGAIINGLANPQGNDSTIQATCPTGNCTFPELFGVRHSTIGMCTKCMDTTPFISGPGTPDSMPDATLGEVRLATNPQSPNNGVLMTVGSTNFSFAQSVMTPEFEDLARNSWGNYSVITVSQSDCLEADNCPYTFMRGGLPSTYRLLGTTCVLYPCLTNFDAEVVDGRLEERVVSTEPAQSPQKDQEFSITHDWVVVKDPCVVDDKIYTANNFSLVPNITTQRAFLDIEINEKTIAVPSDCYYQIDGYYAWQTIKYLNETVMNGTCGMGGSLGFQILCDKTWWLNDLFGKGNATFETLEAAFQNLATVMTNFYRKDGWGVLNDTNFYSDLRTQLVKPMTRKSVVQGQASQTTICMQLEWTWLLLPGLLCLSSILLLAGMVIFPYINHQHPIWKTSLLPLLFYGLDAEGEPQSHTDRGDAYSLQQMEAAAEQTKVRFYAGTTLAAPGLVTVHKSISEEQVASTKGGSTLNKEPAVVAYSPCAGREEGDASSASQASSGPRTGLNDSSGGWI